jgi:TatD DNase family protein
VELIIVTAGSLADAQAAQAFVAQRRAVKSPVKLFTTVGVHPTNALAFVSDDPGEKGMLSSRLVAALHAAVAAGQAAGSVVAVGELGLDYDRLAHCPLAEQRRGFEAQFALAEASGLPLFLHSRNSGADMQAILEANRHRFRDGVVHSFDGTIIELEGLLSLNLFIGLNGCSLRTEANLEVVKALPLERLMLETDAPWCEIRPAHASAKHVRTQKLAAKKPEKFEWGLGVKGRCEPWMIAQVCEVVAAVKGVDPSTVARHAHFNARRVFGL